MSAARIPFVDLAPQIALLQPELEAAFRRVLAHGRFILGPECRDFERAFAAACGTRFCAGASNGTAALHAALHAVGVRRGDEVITTPHTFIATAEAIRHCGARPVFADVDPDTMLLDPKSVASAITPRTRAIVPVHLYGCPADLGTFAALSKRTGIPLIADAAQCHGATYRGRPVDDFSLAASWSFFPGKNLGAFGDAGAVTTNDEALAKAVSIYTNHGRDTKYLHRVDGTNYRFDTLQAALLLVKLPHLAAWTRARQHLAARYRALLDTPDFRELGVRLQALPEGAESVHHLMVVRIPHREEVAHRLAAQGIECGIHYPVPLHLQPALAHLGGHEGMFPHAEAAAAEVLSLPLYPEMPEDRVEIVCNELKSTLQSLATASAK